MKIKFSLEDMDALAIEIANIFYYAGKRGDYCDIPNDVAQLFSDGSLKSLSKQQLPKEFIPKKEVFEHDILEPDSLLSEKWRLKTITNSEGKLELVGEYKY